MVGAKSSTNNKTGGRLEERLVDGDLLPSFSEPTYQLRVIDLKTNGPANGRLTYRMEGLQSYLERE